MGQLPIDLTEEGFHETDPVDDGGFILDDLVTVNGIHFVGHFGYIDTVRMGVFVGIEQFFQIQPLVGAWTQRSDRLPSFHQISKVKRTLIAHLVSFGNSCDFSHTDLCNLDLGVTETMILYMSRFPPHPLVF